MARKLHVDTDSRALSTLRLLRGRDKQIAGVVSLWERYTNGVRYCYSPHLAIPTKANAFLYPKFKPSSWNVVST